MTFMPKSQALETDSFVNLLPLDSVRLSMSLAANIPTIKKMWEGFYEDAKENITETISDLKKG